MLNKVRKSDVPIYKFKFSFLVFDIRFVMDVHSIRISKTQQNKNKFEYEFEFYKYEVQVFERKKIKFNIPTFNKT